MCSRTALLRALVLASAVAALAACSSAPPRNDPDPLPTRGSRASGSNGEAADEGIDGTDGSGEGTAGEAVLNDTPLPVDTDGGGGGGGAKGPTGWCATQTATFCADFDRGALPSGFATRDGAMLSLVARDTTTSALLLNVPPAASGAAFSSKLTQPFTTASSNMTLAFDIFPEKLNTLSGALLVTALDFFGNTSAQYSLRVVMINGRARIEETGRAPDTHPLFDLPVGRWTRLQLDVVLGATTSGTAKVSLDGKQIGSSLALVLPPSMDRKPKLLLGAVYGTTPTDGWKIRYDAVTMTVR